MEDAEQPKTTKPGRRFPWLILSVIVIAVLTGLLAWCYWFKPCPTCRDSTATPAGGESASATGPCQEGAANTAPAGYTFYEDSTHGFKFAYPSSWGAVSSSTAIAGMGGTGGEYLNGSFSGNDYLRFGGNATDFIVSPREGLPLDLPGFLKAADKYYTVEIWRYAAPGSPVENRNNLYPIEETVTEKTTCNTKAIVVTRTPGEIGPDYTYDRASVNLQPTNKYYGLNFELKNPDASRRAELDNVLRTFQLIP